MTATQRAFTSTQIVSPAGGVRLHANCWPGDESESAILLVHGLASNARLWDGVANRLSERGHPVVAVDQRGHGLSDKPSSGYDYQTLFVDLDTVLAHLRDESPYSWAKPVIVGQSWGANVAFEYGWSRPWNASGVVCVDGGTIELSRQFPTWEECEKVLAPPVIKEVRPEDLDAAFRNAHPDWAETSIQGTLANFHVDADGFVQPWLARRYHMAILREMYHHRPSDHYATMSVPVLLVPAGARGGPHSGPVPPSDVEEALAALPTARVRWFPGADHDIHAQHPIELADVIHDAIDDGFLR